MTRALIAAMTLVVAAHIGGAQMPGAAAKAAAQKAAAATNAHIEAEQRVDQQPAAKPAAPPTQPAAPSPAQQPKPTKTTAVASKTPTSKTAPAQGNALQSQTDRPGSKLTVVATDTAGPPPTILREAYEYAKDGRRDPFVSLLTTNDLRPTMSDLRLSGILFDPSGRRSVATLRDVGNNAQYKVTTGSTLGRMRVAAIRLKTVVFTIDEFGTTRQDSLVLGDSTKARGK